MHSFASAKRIRRNFGKLQSDNVIKLPNLIEVQKNSYQQFINVDLDSTSKKIAPCGLTNVFNQVFPIEDQNKTITIEFVECEFDHPKYEVTECIQRGVTYSIGLRVKLRLIIWDVDQEAGKREIKSIKEQFTYFADVPMMTNNGTFVINGAERVIVSQMHRSPGIFVDVDKAVAGSNLTVFTARIIPYRGSWLDFEFDSKDFLYFRIDRKRKIYVSSLFYALGYKKKDLLTEFYQVVDLKKEGKGKSTNWTLPFNPDNFLNRVLEFDLVDAKDEKLIAKKGEKLTRKSIKDNADLKHFIAPEEILINTYLADDVIEQSTGEVLFKAGEHVELAKLKSIEALGIKNLKVISPFQKNGFYLLNTMLADKNETQLEALSEIYRVLRPGEPPTEEVARELFNTLFFKPERYDLSRIGRMKINKGFGLKIPDEIMTLTNEDINATVRKIINVRDGFEEVDDIDHLGNRRVRSVGELVENEVLVGLVKIEKNILERVTTLDLDTIMPNDIINSKPLSTVLKDFFQSSQLSQFMDQTNPLSEVTHKRRVSALGPGGLSRDRAGFEVRDVHPTHYGRICPIETPEGQNIGLINSLSSYATINDYGFIESPYRKVVNAKVTDEVIYFSAIDEGKYTIAQSDANINAKGEFVDSLVSCRKGGDFIMASPNEIDLADVSPKQIVSVAASLIPFLENDDANRALMGSNMMRQAVPLINSEAPLIGTGMESIVAIDSGSTVIAKRPGYVEQVDGNRVVISIQEKGDDIAKGVDIYNLRKFQRTNQNTCINQKPIVKKGDYVVAGDIIADGQSTDLGELALGRNLLVAFMPWNGYNFEDSILLSERIVRDDVFTSIHIKEFEVVARDTKLGAEEITRDIPGVSEEQLAHLDETGIAHIGAEIKAGDILVGKVTPKSESPMTPEEKLLRAIFGEKSADVRDTSLRMSPGISGTVVEVRVFSRRGIEKDERAIAIEMAEIDKLKKDKNDEVKILTSHLFKQIKELVTGQELKKAVGSLKKGQKLTKNDVASLNNQQVIDLTVVDNKVMDRIADIKQDYENINKKAEERLRLKIEKVQSGDDLQPGVLKMVKIFVAIKRKLQPGDKMAGRHGNKGVISKIAPMEDMPHLEDGRVVDIVLNSLGVPSRMNVGQILETHLGWASYEIGHQIKNLLEDISKKSGTAKLREKLVEVYPNVVDRDEVKSMSDEQLLELAENLKKGVPFATPVFDGANLEEIEKMISYSGQNKSGQVTLIDGRTGEKFERPVTVGIIYMLKLHHLVDEKIHARSIGPYSLVTQQPLGGKSHHGGQRFGEMECWALEAYGAAYNLQELLTVKSDDVVGRNEVYKSIIKGENTFNMGMPESFNVMVKELRSLCLNIELRQFEENIEKN